MQLLTRKEVAERLGVKVRTVDKWRKEGRAPRFIKINGNVRCREIDLEQWVDEREEADTKGKQEETA